MVPQELLVQVVPQELLDYREEMVQLDEMVQLVHQARPVELEQQDHRVHPVHLLVEVVLSR